MRRALLVALMLLLARSAIALAEDLSPSEAVRKWTRLYGKDTVQAAALTTDHFRKGEALEKWAEKIQRGPKEIGYAHLGGKITEEIVGKEEATVTLQALIAAIDGVGTQTEVYTLKRVEGRWLIDNLEVKGEIVPRGKNPYPF